MKKKKMQGYANLKKLKRNEYYRESNPVAVGQVEGRRCHPKGLETMMIALHNLSLLFFSFFF